MPAAKQKLEKIPGFSAGVRANSAVRMVKLARPICPNSKIKMVRGEDGKWVAAEVQPQNCQLSGEPRWWEMCESLGHNPYWTIRVWYEPVDIVEEDENGDQIVIGQKRVKHTVKRPNIAQVAVGIRHNSGQGAKFKIERHGFKRLSEIGFEEVCQFRNCQKPLDPKFTGTNYGSFCSYEHTALIGADAESILLNYPEPRLNGQEYERVKREREKQLREGISGA